jgi:hypothetical protein
MVKHDVAVKGVDLCGATQSQPVLLQMNREDFPAAFLRDLATIPTPPASPLSSAQTRLSRKHAMTTAPSIPATLFQPVTRVVHLALVQLACESVGSPRLDPKRVLSAGLVIRRIPRLGTLTQFSVPQSAAWQWMKDPNGQFAWIAPDPNFPTVVDADPDPTLRPQLQSGQPALDQLLTAQTLSSAMTEISTPAFVAAPDVCAAANRTLVYALIPTASKEISTQQPPSPPQFDAKARKALLSIMPTLLKAGKHSSPLADQAVSYLYLSDDYVKAQVTQAQSANNFLSFSATLRLLYTVFGAFENTSDAHALMSILNRRNVTKLNESGSGYTQQPMGEFYQEAAQKLIDYDPNLPQASDPPPQLQMPHAWEFFSDGDQEDIIQAVVPLLQARGAASATPQGRFQDPSRFYRLRLFFRIKSEHPECPPELIWSDYSDPVRIAAWYESSGRATAPVPLPDPTDRNFLQSAKPNSSFAVPSGLMGAMQGTTLSGLSSGTPPVAGSGGGMTWICSFSIPLITICAFFVLNIFLTLLNLVFFWMAFIKICIPFPVPAPPSPPPPD